MASNGRRFKTIIFEDGICNVVRTDVRKPQIMEIVATFRDLLSAKDYANLQNSQLSGAALVRSQIEAATAKKEAIASSNGTSQGLTERQSSVLAALRAKSDDGNIVEIRTTALAEAVNMPVKSLSSVIHSLEKKHRILIARPGSARAPAIYRVL